MPLWLRRSLFLLVAGVAAWIVGYYLASYGFGTVAVALAITVILAIGWMRTYWKSKEQSRTYRHTPARAILLIRIRDECTRCLVRQAPPLTLLNTMR